MHDSIIFMWFFPWFIYFNVIFHLHDLLLFTWAFFFFCMILLFSHDFSWWIYFYLIVLHHSLICMCDIFIMNSFPHVILEWMWRCGGCEVGSQSMVHAGTGWRVYRIRWRCAVMMCSTMWNMQVCSLVPVCVALVILSDSDISVVVPLHPLESSFPQTPLLTRWSLHTAWGEQNRLRCWEED